MNESPYWAMEHPLPTGGVKFFFLSFLPFVKHKKFKWLRDEKENGAICSTLVAINMKCVQQLNVSFARCPFMAKCQFSIASGWK